MNASQVAKEKVLDQLIKAMEEKMLGDLKGKSPKFAKIKIESDDPMLANTLKDKIMEGIEEGPMLEAPEEVMGEPEMEMEEEGDDLERLKELYHRIK